MMVVVMVVVVVVVDGGGDGGAMCLCVRSSVMTVMRGITPTVPVAQRT